MSKFYAIKEGRKKGIFNSWDECQEHVKGFKGAQFKSFKTENEAREYLGLSLENINEYSKLSDDTIDEIKWLLEEIIEQTWCVKPELVENYAFNIADALDIKLDTKKG